jgi:predicted aconitase
MRLTDDEQAMLDGRDGAAVQKAMDLLLRYGEALGAERLVDTRNVAGTIGASTPFMRDFLQQRGGMDAVFSEFNLDSREVVPIPKFKVFTSHLQHGLDPQHPREFGVTEQVVQVFRTGEAYAAARGMQMSNTCAPYLVGNVPVKGEHLAWMESSAVVYANGAIGARTNTEGRESAGAAALTGKIPYWGLHLDENRYATDPIALEVDVASTSDWGMLGYWIGEMVQERIPVVTGVRAVPNLQRLKHFGAAAASSGGVEMYHLVGVTPEAGTGSVSTGPRAIARSTTSCWAVRTIRSSRFGSCASCSQGAKCTRTPACGSSRRAPSRRSPITIATPRSLRKPAGS